MKKSVFVFAVVLFLMVIGFQNCAPSGFQSSPSSGVASQPSATAAFISGLLVDSICQKIASCQSGLDLAQCQSQVNSLGGLPQKFGVSRSDVLTMHDVVTHERDRTLVGSGAFSVECVSALRSLSCEDAGLAGAYDPGAGSYAGVPQLMGSLAVCAQVY